MIFHSMTHKQMKCMKVGIFVVDRGHVHLAEQFDCMKVGIFASDRGHVPSAEQSQCMRVGIFHPAEQCDKRRKMERFKAMLK